MAQKLYKQLPKNLKKVKFLQCLDHSEEVVFDKRCKFLFITRAANLVLLSEISNLSSNRNFSNLKEN